MMIKNTTIRLVLAALLLSLPAGCSTESEQELPQFRDLSFLDAQSEVSPPEDPGSTPEPDVGTDNADLGEDTPPAADPGSVPGSDAGASSSVACTAHADCEALLPDVPGECTTAVCNEGYCAVAPAPDATPCDDGDPCTLEDQCGAGACAGTPKDCDDGEGCTHDACDPLTAECAHLPLSDAVCDDGDACTASDACRDGACAGVAFDCDDGHECTSDSCDSAQGCVFDPAPREGEACDDGDACTPESQCTGGYCLGPMPGCSDGDPCTVDACDPSTGECVHSPSTLVNGLGCDDGDPCTVEDRCQDGACAGAPKDCGDDNACTLEECEAATGDCKSLGAVAAGTECDDEDLCTTGDTCDGPTCAGVAVPCDDGKACTADACDPATGSCVFDPVPFEGEGCDDTHACTEQDSCQGGECFGVAKACDDDNPCTVDGCVAEDGTCAHDPEPLEGEECEADGDPCTSAGTCLAGTCEEPAVVCEDEDPCTVDACDATTGQCVFAPAAEGVSCDDGDVCTTGDECPGPDVEGGCTGTPLDCDDGEACTEDTCVAEVGCVSTPVPGCQKLHPCNASDAPGATLPQVEQCVCAEDSHCCEGVWDDNCVRLAVDLCGAICECTAAGADLSCKREADCAFCDPDGDPCNGSWTCKEGQCTELGPVTCDPSDDLGCVKSTCDPATGDCAPAPSQVACDDGDPCTTDECDETTGDCTNPPIAMCGPHHPCQESSDGGAADLEVAACVCAEKPECCDTAWSAECVELAQGRCEQVCDCAALAANEDLSCAADTDCSFCNAEDYLCAGAWSCVEGGCVPGAPVVCDDLGLSGCAGRQCNPQTGQCEVVGDQAACDDGDACTTDTCAVTLEGGLPTGTCSNKAIDGCGAQPPCMVSDLPRTADLGVEACVCEYQESCCTTAWATGCVSLAEVQCGLTCGCHTATQACGSDADCASCDDGNLCNEAWTCVEGACTWVPPVVCDPGNDVGCWQNQCVPATGECEISASHAACDDGHPCTIDTCAGDDGACGHEPEPQCEGNHPCVDHHTPRSSDAGVTDCVCALEPECCSTEWSVQCVHLAGEHCGLQCNCLAVHPEELECTGDGDCAFCNDDNLCNGAWTCQEGTCTVAGLVYCDYTQDVGCVRNVCDPATGQCVHGPQVDSCEDGDPCTTHYCHPGTGECHDTAVAGCEAHNELCETHPGPAHSDAPAVACTCAKDAHCCSSAWDGACVQAAVESCGLKCGCEGLDAEALACSSDLDCASCDDDLDRCNGTWTCLEGVCKATTAVSCDDPAGCAISECVPETGECAIEPDHTACADGDLCTADVCSTDTGACDNPHLDGCRENHPCVATAHPGSADATVEACVCALDPYCCESSWDSSCVKKAKDSCSATCDCAAAPAGQLGCTTDGQCAACDDDEDRCNGVWTCEDGQCTEQGPVTCDTSGDLGCVQSTCDPFTGTCALAPNHVFCDDGDPCTTEQCDEATEACTNPPIANCAPHHPCEESADGGAFDVQVAACVCAEKPECCDTAWSTECVDHAESQCGQVCDCAVLAANEELPCAADTDCGFCNASDDLCAGTWSCGVNAFCTQGPPVSCNQPGLLGCAVTQCNPPTGQCEVVGDHTACDDQDPCTEDTCSVTFEGGLPTGTCSNTPIQGCPL